MTIGSPLSVRRFLAVLALVVLMAACGGDGDPDESPDPDQQTDPTGEMDARMLTSADLPAGWEEFDGEESGDVSEPDSGFCGEPVPDTANATGSTTVQFSKGEPANRLVETLVTYETAEEATESFDRVQEVVGTCKQWDIDEAGTVSRFTLSSAPFPNVADQTVAARVTSEFTVNAGSDDQPAPTGGFVVGDTVIARHQNLIVVVRHFSIGLGEQPSFAAADTEPAVRSAVERLMQ